MSQQYKSDSLFDNWLQRYENMYGYLWNSIGGKCFNSYNSLIFSLIMVVYRVSVLSSIGQYYILACNRQPHL